ncbi:MAG TPA: ABC transporter substrate-binding protein [Steroidobacteraceae bacterium]|nr:ABC transporter substrate-binding protein [Steroidobacteraceae bacterium]
MDRRQFVLGAASLPLLSTPLRAQTNPLKIGVMNDLSSVYADFQGVGSKVAADLAVADYAKSLGVPVEVIIADHQNKPDIGSIIARRWFDNEGVNVIMDLPNSGVALAVLAVANEKNKTVIGSGAGSAVLTGPQCSKNFVHWTYDTYALGYGLGQAITKEGGKTWFILTADYTFGKDLEKNCTDAVTANGGKVLGVVRHPINTADFSSFLLQAQSSGAEVIAFANAGGDTSQSLKQAAEFGLGQQQRLAALVFDLQHVPPLGLQAAQNVKTIQAFYWDANDETRDFAKRFSAAHPKGEYPNHMHAGMYSATAHLIKAVAQEKNAVDGAKVVGTMKAMPTDDPLFGKGQIRADGRHIHPMYLYETKKPAESKGKWDVFKLVSTLAPNDVWRPLDKGGCPFVKA